MSDQGHRNRTPHGCVRPTPSRQPCFGPKLGPSGLRRRLLPQRRYQEEEQNHKEVRYTPLHRLATTYGATPDRALSCTMAQPCRRLANVFVMSHHHYLPLNPQPSSVVLSRSSSMHASFTAAPLVRTPRRPDDTALPCEDSVSGRVEPACRLPPLMTQPYRRW
jgi:hypothetical protein